MGCYCIIYIICCNGIFVPAIKVNVPFVLDVVNVIVHSQPSLQKYSDQRLGVIS